MMPANERVGVFTWRVASKRARLEIAPGDGEIQTGGGRNSWFSEGWAGLSRGLQAAMEFLGDSANGQAYLRAIVAVA